MKGFLSRLLFCSLAVAASVVVGAIALICLPALALIAIAGALLEPKAGEAELVEEIRRKFDPTWEPWRQAHLDLHGPNAPDLPPEPKPTPWWVEIEEEGEESA